MVKPGWVLLENVVQDRIGHSAFGLVAACSALTIVVATLADLGLTQFTVQRLAAEPSFADSEFPTLLPMRGLLTVGALGLLLAVGWGLGYRGGQLTLLAAVGVGLLLTQYGQFLRAPVQARQHFNTDAVLSVLEKLLAFGAGDGAAAGRAAGAKHLCGRAAGSGGFHGGAVFWAAAAAVWAAAAPLAPAARGAQAAAG